MSLLDKDIREPLFMYLEIKLVEKVDEETLDRLISRELFDRDYTTLVL